MECPRCAKLVPDSVPYCAYCGNPLQAPVAVQGPERGPAAEPAPGRRRVPVLLPVLAVLGLAVLAALGLGAYRLWAGGQTIPRQERPAPAGNPPAGEAAAPAPAATAVAPAVRKTPQVMTYNLGKEPRSLDPALAADPVSWTVVGDLFEGLVRITTDGPKPGLATDWTVSDDRLTYTFRLRDARWTNGDPVTAADFVYAWTRALDPRTNAQWAALQLHKIKGAADLNRVRTTVNDPSGQKDYYGRPEQVPNPDFDKQFSAAVAKLGLKAVDKQTLVVTLDSPTPYFLTLAASAAYMPVNQKAVQSGADWAGGSSGLVSNGPFRLTQWSRNDRLVLEKNPDYWEAGSVKLAGITFTAVADESTASARFEGGELDGNDAVPTGSLPQLVAAGKAAVGPSVSTYYYEFNATRAPFTDVRVRKALSLAIDRRAIVENTTRGGERPALAFVPNGFPNPSSGQDFRAEGGDWYQEDVAAAKQLLADAGYPGGKGFPAFSILHLTDERTRLVAEAIRQMWMQNLGIENIDLQGAEAREVRETIDSRKYDVVGWVRQRPYLDPLPFLDRQWTSAMWIGPDVWTGDQYNALVRTARTAADETARFTAMHQAEEALQEQATVMPIFFDTGRWQEKPWVRGLFRTAIGTTDFKWAYIEPH